MTTMHAARRADFVGPPTRWRIERTDTTGRGDWHYAEPINEVALDLAHATGFLLPALDDWIESAPEWDRDSLRHVMWCRERLLAAVAAGNREARDGFAFYLATLMRLERREKFLVPLARSTVERRADLRKYSASGADATRKYSDKDRENWRALHATKFAKHKKRRAAELIAAELKLSESAIETVRKAL